ncbi:MAG: OmpA family protein [Actinobacteria bacterium]|nr:OmpA family protein [Actinomycetota bacterium]
MRATHRHITARLATATVLVAAALVSLVPSRGGASPAGPSGANVGFDFSWDDAKNPAGHSASFLEADGVTANNCSGGPLSAATKTCNFVFDYQINGAAQFSASRAARFISFWTNPPTYVGGMPAANTGCSSPTSGAGDLGKAPLTLFDCFNANSFGQVFRANVTGPLTEFRVSMTCLAPGGGKYELYALLYEMSADGTSITGNGPIGTNLVNLSKCPTAATWKGKAFTTKDFAMINVNLGNPGLTAGKFYGVYFTGPSMPGTPPVGAVDAMQRAKAASTTTTTTTTTTPWSSFKNQGNTRKPATTTTVARGTSGTTAPSAPTTAAPVPAALFPDNVAATSAVMTAVRVMNSGAEKTYVIDSLTPRTCLGAGRNLVMMSTGRCRAQITLRRNGRVSATLGTTVTDGSPLLSDVVVQVAPPTVVQFRNGTALTTPTARARIANITSDARKADAILVTGHTGNAGGETAKMTQLSQKRAMAARSLLRGRGVSVLIAIQSYGATQAVSTSKKESQQALNRRAEIFIIP